MFDTLKLAVKETGAVDPRMVSDEEVVEGIIEIHRRREQLDAAEAAWCAEAEARRLYATKRAKSAAAWLAWLLQVPQGEARGRLKLGRGLRNLELVRAAWEAGEVSRAQVRLLVDAAGDRSTEALERDQAMLVEQARELPYPHFVRVMDYWCQLADPDGAEDRAEKIRAQNAFYFSQGFEGRWLGDVALDPISGAVVHDALAAIEQQMFEADWAEARARLGEAATDADLRRSPAQRRADALVEMAKRSMAMPPGSHPPVPLFTVLCGYEEFNRLCELANGTVVIPGSLVPFMDEFDAERIVFDGPSRVIDVGRRTRVFRGALRRAIDVRDRTCFNPTCDLPADRCQVDHIVPYAAGGETTQENGRLACKFHNLDRHRRGPPEAPAL